MKKAFFLLLFLPIFLFSAPFTLKAKIEKGETGDYIVTQQDKSISLVRLREVTAQKLVLEEITAPAVSIGTPSSWPNWVKEGAPGHTSWILYEIDTYKGEIIESYSVSQKNWVTIDQPLLPKMLALPLSQTPQDARKRIGPPPQSGEEDRRSLWLPPLVFQGKKVAKPTFEVFETRWPKDESDLDDCRLEFYFLADFPFPLWIEAMSTHYTLKIRTLDAGHHLSSPVAMALPHRPPYFVGQGKKEQNLFKLTLKCPAYHRNFKLSVLDASEPVKPPLSIPFQMIEKENEDLFLTIPVSTLETLLQENHSYRWILTSEEDPHLYAETEELLHFTGKL
jgi:hypothetical protein